MAKKTSIINVVVAGDSKPLRKALGKATKSLGAFSKKVGQIGLAGGVAMAGLGVKAIDLAVDFEEGLSKAQQIFGAATEHIEVNAKKAATAVGMSKSEFLEAASNFGVFGKAAGLSGFELTGFADELVTTAADIASFNNLRPEEAVEKLSAGLRGSMEPLVAVGDELTEGQKIMARHSLILQQLGEQGAMGDFARTSDGLANKQRILTARIKNLGIELGTVLLPVAEKMASGIEFLIGKFEEWAPAIRGTMEAVKNFLAPVKELVRKWFPVLGQKVVDFAKDAWPGVKTAFEVTRDFIKDDLIPKFEEVVEYLKENLPTAGQAFIDHINRNKTKYTMLAGAIAGLATAFGLLVLKAKVGAVVASLYALAGGVGALNVSLAVGLGFFAFVGAMAALYITSEKFRNFTGGIFDWFIEEAKEAKEIVMAIVDGIEKIKDFNFSDILPGGSGFWGTAPWQMEKDDVFSMPPSTNNEMTSSAQGAGTTINVNMPAGSDGQDVVAALQRYVRQNGAADIRTSGAVII